MATSKYGPRVIGEKEFKRQQEIAMTSSNIYGPRVTGEQLKEADEAAGADGYLSVAELKKALAENPALVDVFVAKEEERAAPRKTAIEAMQAAEMERDGGPRTAVLDRLKELANPPAGDGEAHAPEGGEAEDVEVEDGEETTEGDAEGDADL